MADDRKAEATGQGQRGQHADRQHQPQPRGLRSRGRHGHRTEAGAGNATRRCSGSRSFWTSPASTNDRCHIDELFERIETRVVDLDTGDYADDVDMADFDAEMAAKDAGRDVDIPADADVAGLRRRARYRPGLPRTGRDARSSRSSCRSTARASGRRCADSSPLHETAIRSAASGSTSTPRRPVSATRSTSLPGGHSGRENRFLTTGDDPRIEVIKGFVDTNSQDAVHQVDGLAGATLTARGVTNLVQYWTGQNAFGPYLARRREEAAGDD